jgi:hypothetical protein
MLNLRYPLFPKRVKINTSPFKKGGLRGIVIIRFIKSVTIVNAFVLVILYRCQTSLPLS